MGSFNDFLSSAGSSLGTGLINFGLNQVSSAIQRNWQEKMWNKQNEYNSPVQQAARMRAAGLNPYQDMGAVPAGSAGTAAAAAPANVSNPLELLNAFATHDNIVAQTGKTETEQEKILKEMAALDLAYERGLLEKDDYKKRMEAKWKLYEDLGDTEDTAAIKNTLADTEEKKSSADLNVSNARKADSEAALNEARTTLAEAESAYQAALARNADDESKAKQAQLYAAAAASYAAADASRALKEKYDSEVGLIDQQRWNAMNEEQRREALHPYDVQLQQIAVAQGMTHSEILALEAKWQDNITRFDEEGDITLSSFFTRFVMGNVFLTGSASAGSSITQKVIK